MDKANNLKMDEHNILIALAGIISALGLKEVWSIIKQKIDIGAKKRRKRRKCLRTTNRSSY